jgi:hypothetical protein
MANVYEGAPDARQSDRVDEPVSRFRPKYRALTDAEKALHDAIKAKAAEIESLFEQVRELRIGKIPPPAPTEGSEDLLVGYFDPAFGYLDQGMTALELSVMWTVKGLTA